MKKLICIGIDVSNATLDLCVRNGLTQQSFTIANCVKDIHEFFQPYDKHSLIIAMENTGRYNWFLFEVLAESMYKVFVIPPLHLKKSLGLTRGKNDKIDAIRIACFVEKHHQELKPWKPASTCIQKLKILFTERNFRIKTKRQLLNQQHDYPKMKTLGMDQSLNDLNQTLVEQIEQQIKLLEDQIEQLIAQNPQLKNYSDWMKSIPGVGKVLCWVMLAKTEGFTHISEPRKMACYAGVVPFDFQSGTSIKGRKRVSIYADKSVKTALHLAAMSAIRLDNDLRAYYLRKVAEGKNKMLVLNAVRNKIIHRIFAVIQKQKPYQNLQVS